MAGPPGTLTRFQLLSETAPQSAEGAMTSRSGPSEESDTSVREGTHPGHRVASSAQVAQAASPSRMQFHPPDQVVVALQTLLLK